MLIKIIMLSSALLIFSGCETVMPVRSTAYNTESLLDEQIRHNKFMEKEMQKQTRILIAILKKS